MKIIFFVNRIAYTVSSLPTTRIYILNLVSTHSNKSVSKILTEIFKGFRQHDSFKFLMVTHINKTQFFLGTERLNFLMHFHFLN